MFLTNPFSNRLHLYNEYEKNLWGFSEWLFLILFFLLLLPLTKNGNFYGKWENKWSDIYQLVRHICKSGQCSWSAFFINKTLTHYTGAENVMCMAGVVSNEPNYLLVNFLSVCSIFLQKRNPHTYLTNYTRKNMLLTRSAEMLRKARLKMASTV